MTLFFVLIAISHFIQYVFLPNQRCVSYNDFHLTAGTTILLMVAYHLWQTWGQDPDDPSEGPRIDQDERLSAIPITTPSQPMLALPASIEGGMHQPL